MKKKVFHRPTVSRAQSNTGTKIYADASMNFKSQKSQAYGEVLSSFRDFSQDYILQPYFTQGVFESQDKIILYAVDIRYQKNMLLHNLY